MTTAADATTETSEQAPSSRSRVAWETLAWAGIAVGLYLRWRNLGRDSLWLDEGYTVWASQLPLPELLRVLKADVAAPLMYVLLHGWIAIFGDSEFALRSLFAACGTGVLLIFYRVAKSVLGVGLPLVLATWLCAWSEQQILYAHDARYYELLMFEYIVALACLHAYLRRRSWPTFAGIVLATVAMTYTHNVGACYALAINAAWLLLPSDRPIKVRLKEVVAADACMLALYLPYLPMLLCQLQTIHHTFWGGQRGIDTVPSLWTRLIGINAYHIGRRLFRDLYLPVGSEAGLVRIVCVLCGTALLAAVVRSRKKEALQGAGWWVCALVPLTAGYLATQFGFTLLVLRPMAVVGVVVPLLLTLPAAFAQRTFTRIATTTVAAAMLAMTIWSTAVQDVYQWPEDWRSLTAYVASLPPARRVIVFNVTEGQLCFDYYWKRFAPPGQTYPETGLPEGFFDLNPPTFLREVKTDADINKLRELITSGACDEICYVRCHTYWGDPNGLADAYLLDHARAIDQHGFRALRDPLGSNLDVQRYAAGNATASTATAPAPSSAPSTTKSPPGSSGSP